MVIDEAGNMPLAWLPEVAATCAGIGILLVTIWQSKAQLDAAYGRLVRQRAHQPPHQGRVLRLLRPGHPRLRQSGCSATRTSQHRSLSYDVGGGHAAQRVRVDRTARRSPRSTCSAKSAPAKRSSSTAPFRRRTSRPAATGPNPACASSPPHRAAS